MDNTAPEEPYDSNKADQHMINDKIFDTIDYDEWVKNRLTTIRRFQKIRAHYL